MTKLNPNKILGRKLGCALKSFALGSALFCANLNSATAALPEPNINALQIEMYQKAPEGKRVHFLIEMAKAGEYEQVELLLKRFPLQGPHAANRKLFIEGLIKNGRGDFTGAVKNYRAALANDPKLTLVRSELAMTLVKLDQDDSAKHHLTLLAADAPSETDAAGIKSFIEKIDAKRPMTFNGYLSLAPSSNVNGGSNHATVYSPWNQGDWSISSSQQKQSGIGVAAGASVGYSKRLGNKLQGVLAGNVDGRAYSNSDYNSLSFSQSAEIRFLLDQGYLGVGPVANQSIDIAERSIAFHSFGPRASFVYNVTPQNLISANTLYEWRDRAGSSQDDGTASLSSISITHAFDSSSNATVFGGFDRIKTALDTTSYKTISGGLRFYKELPLGLTANVSGQGRFSNFDGMTMLTLTTREDQRYIGSVELTKRDLNWFGFAPSLSYTYTKNKSNIAIYDYDSHAVDFRLTKDF